MSECHFHIWFHEDKSFSSAFGVSAVLLWGLFKWRWGRKLTEISLKTIFSARFLWRRCVFPFVLFHCPNSVHEDMYPSQHRLGCPKNRLSHREKSGSRQWRAMKRRRIYHVRRNASVLDKLSSSVFAQIHTVWLIAWCRAGHVVWS